MFFLDPYGNHQGGSGLTALLPAPKGGGKELGAGKKGSSSSTKTMVPYTLSKRYQDSKKKNSIKKTKLAKKSGGEDSDSDGEAPVSFFSLEATPSVPKTSGLIPVPDDPIPEQEPKIETPNEQIDDTNYSNTTGPSLPEQYISQYYSTNEQYAYVQDPSIQGYPNQYPEVTEGYSQVSSKEVSNVPDTAAVGPGLSIDEDQVRSHSVHST